MIQEIPEYKECLNKIKRGDNFVFVTGKAGTGKSYLIKYLKSKLQGQQVVYLAPTGIASLNIEGQTIHSFFGLSPKIIIKNELDLNIKKRQILEKVDIIIIDEISMVRADVLDGIDHLLKLAKRSRQNFGGVQIICLGDLFQLSPVVVEDEKEVFYNLYDCEYFFGSEVMESIEYNPIFLDNVFRQSDLKTIEIFNNIREGKNIRDSLAFLNRNCYGVNAEYRDIPRDLTLCAYNQDAAQINFNNLRNINSKSFQYKAIILGDFKFDMPTPALLELKKGAQVMFTRNISSTIVNGTLAKVVELSQNAIFVRIIKTGEIVEVTQIKWEKFKYEIEDGELVPVVTGSFKQYPLMLAWAISIHKSQGLTLDSLKIELGRGAFTSGQLYVGLSRAKSLLNLSLSKPLKISDVKVDPRVVKYYQSFYVNFPEC